MQSDEAVEGASEESTAFEGEIPSGRDDAESERLESAEMAEAAGSSALVVSLIRRHQDDLPETALSEEDELLHILQWADDQN